MKTSSSTRLALRRSFFSLLLLLTVKVASAQLTAQAGTLPSVTTSDGVQLYVRVAGQGQPCVFVHGGPGAGCEAIETLAGPQYQSFHFKHQRVVLMPGKHYALLENPHEVSQALATFVRQLPRR